MNHSDQIHILRGMVASLACAIYNREESWDKQAVSSFLHMGDPSLGYMFRGEPPAALDDEDVFKALDRLLEQNP